MYARRLGRRKDKKMSDESAEFKEISAEDIAEASRYRVVVYWSEEDQVFIGEIPELYGARTHGDSVPEAAEMAVEVAAMWLSTARELGWAIPTPMSMQPATLAS